MAYAKFSRIPSFAKGTVGNEVPPVPLPNFAPRPYTFEQYDAVYKNSLERPNQVVSPKSIMDLTGLDRESATEMFEDFVERVVLLHKSGLFNRWVTLRLKEECLIDEGHLTKKLK